MRHCRHSENSIHNKLGFTEALSATKKDIIILNPQVTFDFLSSQRAKIKGLEGILHQENIQENGKTIAYLEAFEANNRKFMDIYTSPL